jgi:cell division protein FtsQ
MNKTVKYLLFALSVALFAAVTMLVLVQAHGRRHLTTCNSVEISFRDTLAFVGEDDIRAILAKDIPAITGTRIDSIRLDLIEKKLNSQSMILESQAWAGDDGVLHISIRERMPVAKMVSHGNSFYIDAGGCVFPVQGACKMEVPVFEGELPLHDPAWFPSVLGLLDYMKRHRREGSISCFEVQRDGNLMMHPREGKEIIIFGKPEKAASKFARIDEYYRKIKPAKEEGYYSTVNVKYEGQIVCRK